MHAAVAAMFLAGLFTSAIKSDEEIVFYPGYAWLEKDEAAGGQRWIALVRGCVFEPEADSIKRKLLIRGIRRSLGVEADSPEAKILDQRVHHFLVDLERRKEVSIRIGEKEHRLGVSDSFGQFEARLAVAADEAQRLAKDDPAGGRWLPLAAVLPADDARRFVGRVQLLPAEGLSIVSDIDDTIKITEVRDRTAMLRNTFLREFRAAPGMAELYRRAAGKGAAFHYVSGGPWQLFPPLEDFRREAKFPPGTFHMKRFRLSDPKALARLSEHGDAKRSAIGDLLKAFPRRRFVLIGDSGEQDPEIYGPLARENPKQVVAVLIRNVTDEPADGERFRKAFDELPPSRWRVFAQPAEATEMLDAAFAGKP
jgi:hypothetical protein